MKIGQKLKNGAYILDIIENKGDDYFLLCFWPNNPQPFVTWMCDSKGNTYWGHYFNTLDEVIEYFRNKKK